MEALLFVGTNRPLHPQCNPHSSAVRLLAHYLRAKNPLISGYAKAEAEAALQTFVQGRSAVLPLQLLLPPLLQLLPLLPLLLLLPQDA